VLLPALDEHLLQVPHIGEVRAVPGFQVIATQNPVEYIATGHLSEALRDRFEHQGLSYQTATEEEAIVAAETGSGDIALIRTAVRLARATRLHPLFRRGASVRAAMSTVSIAEELCKADGVSLGHVERATLRCAAEAGFTTRVHLRDETDTDFATAFDEVFELVVDRGLDPDVVLASGAPKSRRAPVGAPEEERAQRDLERFEGEPPTEYLAEEPLDDEEFIAYIGRHTAGSERDPRRQARACTLSGQSVEDVLAQAASVVGPLRGATHNGARADAGVLYRRARMWRRTLENIVGKRFPERDDWIVQRREERRHQVVMMLDASLSMAGENIAVAAVAVAVMALKLKPEDLAVIVFEDEARVVTRLEVADPPEEVVRSMLAEPGWGVTDIEAALKLGAAELAAASTPAQRPAHHRRVVTKGAADPSELARHFPALHVLLTEDKVHGPRALPPDRRSRPGRRVSGARHPRPSGPHARCRKPCLAIVSTPRTGATEGGSDAGATGDDGGRPLGGRAQRTIRRRARSPAKDCATSSSAVLVSRTMGGMVG